MFDLCRYEVGYVLLLGPMARGQRVRLCVLQRQGFVTGKRLGPARGYSTAPALSP